MLEKLDNQNRLSNLYILHLLQAAMNADKIPKPPKEIEINNILDASARNMLSAVVYEELRKGAINVPETATVKYNEFIAMYMAQEHEAGKVIRAFAGSPQGCQCELLG